jgi:hypothetical protein
MSKSEREYVIRIGPADRYRHSHIKERGKIAFFRVQYETRIAIIRSGIRRKAMSKEKKMVERNIELSAEFSRYLFEHPEIEERIPAGAEIVLLPEFDKELKAFNIKLGKDIEVEGGKVAYVSIKSMLPKSLSRIEAVELESVA